MSILIIAANSLRRLFRERTNLFFVFALPLLLIVVLGLAFAGAEPHIGVLVDQPAGTLAERFVADLEDVDGARTSRFTDREEALELLRREELTGLVVIPADYDDSLTSGATVDLGYLAIPNGQGFEVQAMVEQVVAAQNSQFRTARLLSDVTGLEQAESLTLARDVGRGLDGTEVTTVDPDGQPFIEANAFGFVAAQELVLFMFLISMVAAAALIQVRKLGVARRMVATPASVAEVVAGHALGRYAVVIVQGIFILAATALAFGVDWGSWPATIAIVATFSLVATAAALLIGALVSNENQSSAIGVSLGLIMAAFGGCMVPLEVFPDTLRTAAHVTPHAWAVDAFNEILQRGGGLADIQTELAVLTLYGIGLLGVGTLALRRTLTG